VTGRRLSLLLFTSLLVSRVGLGGWSTPVPSLAHPIRDATDVVIYQDPQEDVADVSVFYEPLAPFGTWIALPEYDWVWRPHGVPPGWRPYTMGRWVYTDYGWTWVSDWEWGWAPFHYGRWAFVTSYGWVWIPGTVWGPAWVIWRYAPGWVGWAPLPPQVVFRPDIALSVADINVYLEPSWFCFVEERRILAPKLITYIAPLARNGSLIQMTRNVTHYTVIQHRVVNRSIPVERIERAIARPVPRMRIVEAQSPEVMPRAKVRETAREVVMFRPGASAVAGTTGPRGQPLKSTPPPQLTPGTTHPQQQQDAHRRLGERQAREQGALEERQHNAPPPQPQGLSPQERRMQRETERRTLEGKARRNHQAHEPQLGQPQPSGVPHSQPEGAPSEALQQRREAERRALGEKALRDRQSREQQLQQRQEQEHQRALPPQAHERQRAARQQPPHHSQPPLPQGIPPQVSQPRRTAPQPALEAGKEHRKKPPHPPPSQHPSQP
jgi:hypothetical protein